MALTLVRSGIKELARTVRYVRARFPIREFYSRSGAMIYIYAPCSLVWSARIYYKSFAVTIRYWYSFGNCLNFVYLVRSVPLIVGYFPVMRYSEGFNLLWWRLHRLKRLCLTKFVLYHYASHCTFYCQNQVYIPPQHLFPVLHQKDMELLWYHARPYILPGSFSLL